MRTVEFYRLPNNICPIEESLDSLSGKKAQKILWVMQLIEEMEMIPHQYFNKLIGAQGIWEIRVQFGNDIFRLLGFFYKNTFLVLTNGFAKKTQNFPS